MAKVYVSSTYDDLKECRKAVEQELRRLGHIDIAMETYAAEHRSSLQRCLEDVARCDIYVGIFAWRYGWVPERDNPELRSITELEYRKAVLEGKPCLIFLLDPSAPWPVNQVETDRMEVIRALRNELSEAHNPQLFHNCDDLRAAVVSAVVRYSSSNPTAAAGRIYSIPEKVRLIDGIIEINQRSVNHKRPRLLSVAGLPLGTGLYAAARGAGGDISLSLALGAFAIIIFLTLAVVAVRSTNQAQIRAQTLDFYRSLYKQCERDPATVDAKHLDAAERFVAKYLKQGVGTE